MIEISELAYNLLGLSHHIMFNVQKIFPEFSYSKVEQAKVICDTEFRKEVFEKCSEFISDFRVMTHKEKVLIAYRGDEEKINKLFIPSEHPVSKMYLYLIPTLEITNPFNNKIMMIAAAPEDTQRSIDYFNQVEYIQKKIKDGNTLDEVLAEMS